MHAGRVLLSRTEIRSPERKEYGSPADKGYCWKIVLEVVGDNIKVAVFLLLSADHRF